MDNPTINTPDESTLVSKQSDETLLGRLPTELLQVVTRFHNKPDIATISPISPKLRALANRRLYLNIELSLEVQDWGRINRNHTLHWLLCRTLSHRPDLAEKVSSLYVTAHDLSHEV
jgi:hypothetical protein